VDWEVSPQVGLGEPGIYRIDDAGVQLFDIPSEFALGVNEPRRIEVAPNGDVWLASFADVDDRTTAMLGRYDGLTWRIFSAFRKFGTTLPVERFDDRLSIGPDGRVWVAAGRNLAVFDRGRWSKLPVDGGGVTSVSVAPDGAVWVGIRTAIHRFPSDWPASIVTQSEPTSEGRFRLVPLVMGVAVAAAVTIAWLLRRRRWTRGR
jgi:hypothetical protein